MGLERLRSVGRRLARALKPGDVLLLEGQLGSGKTELVREVCRGLGVEDDVRSPSFTLANVYEGPVRVNHLDLYRVAELAETDALVPEEYVEGDAVTMVEWPGAAGGRLGSYSYSIRLEHETLDTRVLHLVAAGAEPAGRWKEAGDG